jgi:urease accessory protein
VQRATRVIPADHWNVSTAIDRVVLDADERRRRRIVLTGERGTSFLLDLPQITMLRDGDGLVFEDGTIVRVAGKSEALTEITAASAREVTLFAWHIGNRHVDMQIVCERLRIRRDHVIEPMLRSLGACLTPIEAPFDPEPGAYGPDTHRHDHGDGHGT